MKGFVGKLHSLNLSESSLTWDPAERDGVGRGGEDVDLGGRVRLPGRDEADDVAVAAVAVVGHAGEEGLVVLGADVVQLEHGIHREQAVGHGAGRHHALSPKKRKIEKKGEHRFSRKDSLHQKVARIGESYATGPEARRHPS